MNAARPGSRVKIHYTVRLESGQVVGSSKGGQPLSFTIGKGKVIQGLEDGVVNMVPGESRSITIPPEAGYGHRKEERVLVIPKERMPKEMPLESGRTVQYRSETGEVVNLVILSVAEDRVIVDGNHPFAGQTLIYDVVLLNLS